MTSHDSGANLSSDLASLRSELRREARRLVADPDECDDLVQECLVTLATHGHTIRDPSQALPWCRAVLRNVYRQRLRRRWYMETVGMPALPEPRHDPWPAVDIGVMVSGAIEALRPGVGRAVRSFYLGGHGIRDIARDEGWPEGTIKRWLHEGREALRMTLAQCEQDRPLARIYGSNWLEDALQSVVRAAAEAGYEPLVSELPGDAALPTDAALLVFGEMVGERPGLELLLSARGTEATAATPVLLFGPPRQTAALAAWQAGADAYLTNPSSPDVASIMAKLRLLGRERP